MSRRSRPPGVGASQMFVTPAGSEKGRRIASYSARRWSYSARRWSCEAPPRTAGWTKYGRSRGGPCSAATAPSRAGAGPAGGGPRAGGAGGGGGAPVPAGPGGEPRVGVPRRERPLGRLEVVSRHPVSAEGLVRLAPSQGSRGPLLAQPCADPVPLVRPRRVSDGRPCAARARPCLPPPDIGHLGHVRPPAQVLRGRLQDGGRDLVPRHPPQVFPPQPTHERPQFARALVRAPQVDR